MAVYLLARLRDGPDQQPVSLFSEDELDGGEAQEEGFCQSQFEMSTLFADST